MKTEQNNTETHNGKGADFASKFKNCREIFEGMSECCQGYEASSDCSDMMKQMMKSMKRMCFGTKTEDQRDEG